MEFQFDDDNDVRFVLGQHAYFEFYSANAGRHAAPRGHIILILSQPVLALAP